MRGLLLPLLLLLGACDIDVDAPIDLDFDPCRFLSYTEPPPTETCGDYLAPDIPIPRLEGEPCRASSGEVCKAGLVCGCGVCVSLR